MRFSLLFLLLGAVSPCAYAQPGLGDEQVEVIKNFEAQLQEAEKIGTTPVLPPVETERAEFDYRVTPQTLSVPYPAPTIRPLAMKREALPENYRGYLKAGVGLPFGFYADGSYYTYREDQRFDFGADVFHHSAASDDPENQRFMYNAGALYGTYYTEQGLALRADAGFTSDRVHFFGYQPAGIDTSGVPAEDVRQTFNIVDLGVKAYNSERTVADFDYLAEVDFYTMTDDYAVDEQGTRIELSGTKWFDAGYPLQVKVVADFTGFEDTLRQALNNLHLQPSFTFVRDRFRIKLGTELAWSDDEFFVFPDVSGYLSLLGNRLGAFAGATGSLRKNTFRTLTDYNPFLISRAPGLIIANTRYLDFYAGVKGDLGTVQYSAQAGYKTADDLPLYLLLNDDRLAQRFRVVYDDVGIFNVQGSATAELVEGIGAVLGFVYNNYNPTRQEKAWHLPSTTVNLGARYTALEEKLIARADLYLENGVPFRNERGAADRLNGLFDFSLGADYYFTDRLGGFVQLNNLAGNRRQRWRNYPTYGINVLLGVSARF